MKSPAWSPDGQSVGEKNSTILTYFNIKIIPDINDSDWFRDLSQFIISKSVRKEREM